jgi:hypothetical protein
VAAAGKVAGLTGTREVAADSGADSGADRGTVGEDTAAAAGGLGGSRDTIENCSRILFYRFRFVFIFHFASFNYKCSVCSYLFFP